MDELENRVDDLRATNPHLPIKQCIYQAVKEYASRFDISKDRFKELMSELGRKLSNRPRLPRLEDYNGQLRMF